MACADSQRLLSQLPTRTIVLISLEYAENHCQPLRARQAHDIMRSMSSYLNLLNTFYDILYEVSFSDEEEIRTKAKEHGLNDEEIEQAISFVLSRLPWIVIDD